MSERAPSKPSVVLVERVRHILDGLVQSRSTDRQYIGRIVLYSNLLCTCPASQMRDSKCAHLKEILEQLDADELRQFILDSHQIPIDNKELSA